jgi:hypothetical protein
MGRDIVVRESGIVYLIEDLRFQIESAANCRLPIGLKFDSELFLQVRKGRKNWQLAIGNGFNPHSEI